MNETDFPANATAIAIWNPTKTNRDGTTGGWDVMGGSLGGRLPVLLVDETGVAITSLGGGSSLPTGPMQSEPNAVYADTDKHEIIFTNPYRGVILSLQSPATALPAAYAIAAFDVPSAAVGEDWTNAALAGPHVIVHQSPHEAKIGFQDAAGAWMSVSNMYYRFPAVATGYIMKVRGII
jgi:hypothetical protein